MTPLQFSLFLIFPLFVLSTDPRSLLTSSDGHLYTLMNNYGIWASIIVYGLFWLLVFLAICIPFEANSESYSPLKIEKNNRVNMEMAHAKLDSPDVVLSSHIPTNKAESPNKIPMALNESVHDAHAIISMRALKISPIYSILKSRTYSDSTKKISMFIINIMTIIMFLSILYNSDHFDVDSKNEQALGISIIALMISWVFKYIYGFIKELIMGKSVNEQNFKSRTILFWVLFQLEFWSLAIVICHEMGFQSDIISNYWVASIFISLFFEILLFDPIVILIVYLFQIPRKSCWHCFKYNGYC